MNVRQERAFARKFCQMLDSSDCDMSNQDKRKLKFNVIFRPFVRNAIFEQFEETYEDQDVGMLASSGLAAVSFTSIDWESFDWEAAAQFWTDILKMVIEIIMVFI